MDAVSPRPDLMPPRSLVRRTGGYAEGGREFFRYFVDLGGLLPDQRVLDIGSGVGRMAIPLTDYLHPPGGYEGFDIMATHVDWCQRNITPRFPHFRFQRADIFNDHYNPEGTHIASEFRFPYGDRTFEFAFATSVFTHMGAVEVRRYIQESARVLKPGGAILATFFLLDADSESAIDAGRSHYTFNHQYAGFRSTGEGGVVMSAVAYTSADMRSAFEQSGLVIHSVHRGTWSGLPGLSWQDIVIARRPH